MIMGKLCYAHKVHKMNRKGCNGVVGSSNLVLIKLLSIDKRTTITVQLDSTLAIWPFMMYEIQRM